MTRPESPRARTHASRDQRLSGRGSLRGFRASGSVRSSMTGAHCWVATRTLKLQGDFGRGN